MLPDIQSQDATSHRTRFTKEDDARLKSIVAEYRMLGWNVISKIMGNKSSRKCRERFRNYLSPELTRMRFTVEEDARLEALFEEYGGQWSKLVKSFPGRSDVMLKNRWCSMVGHKVRREQAQRKALSKASPMENAPGSTEQNDVPADHTRSMMDVPDTNYGLSCDFDEPQLLDELGF